MKAIKGFKGYINNEGLIDIEAWNFLDWAGMDTPHSGVVTHQNALFVKAVKDTAYIAAVQEKKEDMYYLNALSEKVKIAINKNLWCDEKQAYIDCIHSDGCVVGCARIFSWSIYSRLKTY